MTETPHEIEEVSLYRVTWRDLETGEAHRTYLVEAMDDLPPLSTFAGLAEAWLKGRGIVIGIKRVEDEAVAMIGAEKVPSTTPSGPSESERPIIHLEHPE